MNPPLELKVLDSKPRAASTSEIETRALTSIPKRPKSKIQFKLFVKPGETTPLMVVEPEQTLDVTDVEQTKGEIVSTSNEIAIIPTNTQIERQTSEEEEEILEVLRRVVRSCTDVDLSKRPTANEILEMLTKYLESDDNLE